MDEKNDMRPKQTREKREKRKKIIKKNNTKEFSNTAQKINQNIKKHKIDMKINQTNEKPEFFIPNIHFPDKKPGKYKIQFQKK